MTVVLAPVDGSTRALRAVPWAEKFAGPDGTVILLRVVPPQPDYAESLFSLVGAEGTVQEIQDAWNQTAEADLEEAAALLSASGVTVEQMVAAGEPDEEIVAAVARRGVQMIAMASHGRGAVGRAIFGSVADRVARTATVPVLILRAPDEDVDSNVVVSRIVVPLDGSQIAARALPIAGQVAKQFAAPVHVVRAVDAALALPMASGVFGAGPVVNADVTDQIWQEAEAEAQATVTAAVSRLQAEGVDASGGIVNGSPFFAISEMIEPGDLLILTSHGRGGVRRWLLGSVAEKLVREAKAPVMLVPAVERGE
ncbi:MAG: universal stress protein, partial [Thermomicrobiales bacterium]|nr:universal stress protein [Thermomicrobiales bacterium]